MDRVAEMMNELAFVAWMAKPKNGSVDALTASALFKQKCKETGAIVDEKGSHPKHKTRVCVHKSDLVTRRDASIHSQMYHLKDKEIKKAGQAEVDKAEARLSKDCVFQASSSRTRQDEAASMISSAAAASCADGGAFSSEGKAAAHIGNRELISDSEDEGGAAQADEDVATSQLATTSKRSQPDADASDVHSGSGKKTKTTPWLD